MTINQLAIKKSTDFILFQNFANLQILTLNVQKPIIHLSAPFMQIRVDIHNTCPPWRFPCWSANSSPCKSSHIAQAPNRPGTYATASASTWTTCCFQTANNLCISFTSPYTISLQIQASHRLLTSGNIPNVELANHPREAAVGY